GCGRDRIERRLCRRDRRSAYPPRAGARLSKDWAAVWQGVRRRKIHREACPETGAEHGAVGKIPVERRDVRDVHANARQRTAQTLSRARARRERTRSEARGTNCAALSKAIVRFVRP